MDEIAEKYQEHYDILEELEGHITGALIQLPSLDHWAPLASFLKGMASGSSAFRQMMIMASDILRANEELKKMGQTVEDITKDIVEIKKRVLSMQPLLSSVKEFVLSRRDDIENDIEDLGMLKPALKYFLEAEG